VADAVVITPRLIAVEDLAASNQPGQTFTDNVLGVGPSTLTMIPITLLTQLVVAASDAAAAAAGVGVGGIYILSPGMTLQTRLV
jgi:hypothetical protein